MLSQDDDRQLVARVQRGDKRAFDLLVLKYQHRVVGLVSHFVADFHEARIAINTAKNHLASRGRRPPGVDVDINDEQFYESEQALKDIDSPERLALRDEIEAATQKALASLPADLRMALNLREFEGLSYEDIASVMQCPVGTVRSRLFRARELLDKALQPLLVSI